MGQTDRTSGSFRSALLLIGGFRRGRTVLANQSIAISQHISCFEAPDQPTFRQVTSSHNGLDIIGSQHHNDDHDDDPFPLLVLDASPKDTTAITGSPRRFEILVNSMVDIGHQFRLTAVLPCVSGFPLPAHLSYFYTWMPAHREKRPPWPSSWKCLLRLPHAFRPGLITRPKMACTDVCNGSALVWGESDAL